MVQVLRIADEKINLAHQIYDFVDRNICQLDKDLKSFDAELNVEGSRLGIVVLWLPFAIHCSPGLFA